MAHRILALFAIGGDDEWAHSRNLHDDTDLQNYIFVTMCWRHRGSNAAFDKCVAKYGARTSIIAPKLFDEIAEAAHAQLDAGQWSWGALSIVASADVRRGREAELNDRVARLLVERPDRAALILRTVESARDQQALPCVTPQRLEPRGPLAIEALGTFEVDSPVLTVGDPGYTHVCLRFHRLLLGVRLGTWRATVVRSPNERSQCVLLVAHHVAHPCVRVSRNDLPRDGLSTPADGLTWRKASASSEVAVMNTRTSSGERCGPTRVTMLRTLA